MSALDPAAWEIYKLAVEMADRISARRGTTNAFFLTAQTTFLAVLALALPTQDEPGWAAGATIGAGLLISASWWLQLRSYRDLNRAKFEVILELEKALPVALYGKEWDSLKQDRVKLWRPRYAELGTVERTLPVAFAVLYVVLLVGRLT